MERSLIYAQADILLLCVGAQDTGPRFGAGLTAPTAKRKPQRKWAERKHQVKRHGQQPAQQQDHMEVHTQQEAEVSQEETQQGNSSTAPARTGMATSQSSPGGEGRSLG